MQTYPVSESKKYPTKWDNETTHELGQNNKLNENPYIKLIKYITIIKYARIRFINAIHVS